MVLLGEVQDRWPSFRKLYSRDRFVSPTFNLSPTPLGFLLLLLCLLLLLISPCSLTPLEPQAKINTFFHSLFLITVLYRSDQRVTNPLCALTYGQPSPVSWPPRCTQNQLHGRRARPILQSSLKPHWKPGMNDYQGYLHVLP